MTASLHPLLKRMSLKRTGFADRDAMLPKLGIVGVLNEDTLVVEQKYTGLAPGSANWESRRSPSVAMSESKFLVHTGLSTIS